MHILHIVLQVLFSAWIMFLFSEKELRDVVDFLTPAIYKNTIEWFKELGYWIVFGFSVFGFYSLVFA